MGEFLNSIKYNAPGSRALYIALVVLVFLPTCILGSFYLGLPPRTSEQAWSLLATRFYVLPVVVVPYVGAFLSVNYMVFRKAVARPLRFAVLYSLIDFASIAVLYAAFVFLVLARKLPL